MNAFLAWGLIAGGTFLLLYFALAAKAKKPPVLNDAIEIIMMAVGASGGVKVCLYVASGQLKAAFRLALQASPNSSVVVSEDDVVYFLIGGLALVWISFQGIMRVLWPLYEQIRLPSDSLADSNHRMKVPEVR
jgi:hypothetical protein